MQWDTYGDYLRSHVWRYKRDRVWDRAGGWCERCRRDWGADVHHLRYCKWGDEKLDQLILVCRACHEFLHGRTTADPKQPATPADDPMEVVLVVESAAARDDGDLGEIRAGLLN